MGVVADHGRVQVAKSVHLGSAEERDLDAARPDPVVEHLRHRDDRVGRLGQLAVTDRERDVSTAWRRSCPTRRPARGSGLWTIRARIAAVLGRPTPMNTERACSSRRAATIVCTSAVVAALSVLGVLMPPPRACRAWWPVPSRTCSCIQAVNRSRSRLISSHDAVEVVVARGDAVAVGRPRPARRGTTASITQPGMMTPPGRSSSALARSARR